MLRLKIENFHHLKIFHRYLSANVANKDTAITQKQIQNSTFGGKIYTKNVLNMSSSAAVSRTGSGAMGPHALLFKIERIWAVGMLPILPAAYFVHSPLMDFALSFAIVMHSHWGMMAVVQDYARPIVMGETAAKIAPWLVYFFTIVLMAGLFQFNTNDVGLTKAFEMAFSL